MQATIDGSSLKPFIRALACLAKYSDDLCLHATPNYLLLSATHSSKSAYCRFKYDKHFFVRYHVENNSTNSDDDESTENEYIGVTGQVVTKSLISVFRHRTVEKSVERCDLSIVEGIIGTRAHTNDADPENDSVESKVIIRLHCNYGVIKTHRLLLMSVSSLLSPTEPENDKESSLTIGSRTLKDIIDHFPVTKGTKADPQLVWTFRSSDVEVKSFQSALGAKGMDFLSTELSISTDDFDDYNLYSEPTVLSFHLKEFNATISFAESMSLPLDLRFIDRNTPLFIDVEAENVDALFVISTSQVTTSPGEPPQLIPTYTRKRRRDPMMDSDRHSKQMRVVQGMESSSRTGSSDTIAKLQSDKNASLFLSSASQQAQANPDPDQLDLDDAFWNEIDNGELDPWEGVDNEIASTQLPQSDSLRTFRPLFQD